MAFIQLSKMTETTFKKDWLRIFSPCIITSILTIIAIVESLIELNKSGGWSLIGVIVGLPFLAILLLIDFLIKFITKVKTFYIWIIELMLIAIIALVFFQLMG